MDVIELAPEHWKEKFSANLMKSNLGMTGIPCPLSGNTGFSHDDPVKLPGKMKTLRWAP